MNRSFTWHRDESSCGDTIWPPPEESNQRWVQMLISTPSPILHRAPLRITSLACNIFFQAKELRVLKFVSRMLPEGKYFGLNTLYSRVSFSWRNLHTCLPRSASLNCRRSRKPMPPKDFGEHRVLYLTHCIFLEFSWLPHQNLRIIASISLINPIGSRNTLIE